MVAGKVGKEFCMDGSMDQKRKIEASKPGICSGVGYEGCKSIDMKSTSRSSYSTASLTGGD